MPICDVRAILYIHNDWDKLCPICSYYIDAEKLIDGELGF